MDLDYFLKINNTSGTTSKKDTMLYDVKSYVNDRFDDSIDFYTVLVNGINQDLLIVRTTDENKKTIKARPNEDFEVGDYVVWNSNSWLVTSKDTGNQVYTSGKMQLCNYTLKWQNSTGTILSYPCITSNKSFNEDENKVITLGANQKSILLPYDDNTSALTIEKRMYVDKRNKTPYKPIGDIDTTTYNYGSKGLIYFIMEQNLSQDNTALPDRPDLGICNYIEPTTPPTPSPSGYTMTITPNMDLTLDSSFWCIFTPTLKDSDGNTITDWIASWNINYNGMDTSKFSFQYVDKTCQVKCTDDTYDIVDRVLGLTCSDGTVSGGYNATIMM